MFCVPQVELHVTRRRPGRRRGLVRLVESVAQNKLLNFQHNTTVSASKPSNGEILGVGGQMQRDWLQLLKHVRIEAFPVPDIPQLQAACA